MTDDTRMQLEKIDTDLRFLLDCLREVLNEIGETDAAALLPWYSDGEINGADFPAERLSQLYSIAFQLLNMVEENAAVQVRRIVESKRGPAEERGLWGNTLQRLIDEGFGQTEIAGALSRIHVEPVLTAHPTEAKRATVIAKHRALYLLLVRRENPILTPMEQFQIRREIKELLELLWRTGNIYQKKPDVASERRNIIHYLKNIFPETLPILDQRLKYAWKHHGLSRDLLGWEHLPKLTFGTWVGGDRDGHPLVTADVTHDTLRELRLNALIIIRHRLVDLAARLSLADHLHAVPDSLTQWISDRGVQLGDAGKEALLRNPGESWRQAVNLIVAGLPLEVIRDHATTLDDTRGYYRTPEQLRHDLSLLDHALREADAARIADMDVSTIIRLLDAVGFHLATLDIRQNSAFHDRAMEQIFAAAGMAENDFPTWPEEKRQDFLSRELATPRPFLLPGKSAGSEADAVLGCYRVLAEQIANYGAEGIGSLIVSMTRSCSDLLTVYLLAREAGLLVYDEQGGRSLLKVVPLFETIDDLLRAPDILREFLDHPVTRRTLTAENGKRPLQQVMVGYSDSCKDGGIVASQGALYRAQLELTRIGDAFGVDIRFFHGRGGSIGRGAGPTFRFLEGLPPGALRGSFRMTEQGETIAQKYANPLTATYNLELQLAGVLGMTVRNSGQTNIPPELSTILEYLVNASERTYKGLINSDGFMEFYSQATPIDVMEHLKIGSRPSRRTGRRTLADLRAIPWVFSWNQSRFLLPSWYGAGTALAGLNTEKPELCGLLSADIAAFPPLRYLFMNIELATLQADLEIMRAYATLVGDQLVRERYMGLIEAEYALTCEMLRKFFPEPLSVRRPMQLAGMNQRTAPLAVLHRRQIALLKQWRTAQNDSPGDKTTIEVLLEELFLTVNAIASGIRNTG